MIATMCEVCCNSLSTAQNIDIALGVIVTIATILYVICTWKILQANQDANTRLDKQFAENQKANQLTHSQIEQKKINKTNVYLGLLRGILIDIEYHNKSSVQLIKELDSVAKYVRTTGEINLSRSTNLFQIDFIKLCRKRFLAYRNFKSDLF